MNSMNSMNALLDASTLLGLYISNVDALVAAGGKTSPRFESIRSAYNALLAADAAKARTRVTEAVAAGDGKAVRNALAELGQLEALDLPGIKQRAAKAARPALRDAYTEVAADNYALAAQKFDEATRRFNACAEIVSLSLNADEVVSLDDAKRKAWIDGLRLAKEMDATYDLLVRAAHLAGLAVDDDDGRLSLACDPGKIDRRKVWEAWTGKDPNGKTVRHRCGRWGPLAELEVVIRACPIGEHEPYRKPKPLETRIVTVGRGIWRQETVDPEKPETADAEN